MLNIFRKRKVGDRGFKNAVLKTTIEKDIDKKDFVDKISQISLQLKAKKQNSKEGDVIFCEPLLRFNEFFDRMISRYSELREVEFELLNWDLLQQGRMRWDNPRSLHDIQMDFVDKTESFHQQIYAVLSAFVKLLTDLSPKSFSSQIPIRSIKSFLNFSSEKFSVLAGESELLKNAVDYRDKFVDHTSQNKNTDWQTFSLVNKAFIVYFQDRGHGSFLKLKDIIIDEVVPDNITTMFVAKKFASPPHHFKILKTLTNFCQKFLESIHENLEKNKT